MFSNLYYLSKLIDKSLSFSQIEKQKIFNYVKNNEWDLNKIIRIFENEQKGLSFIKRNYNNNINEIWKNFKKELNNKIDTKDKSDIEIIRNKIKKMNVIELEEKEKENLDTLINNI